VVDYKKILQLSAVGVSQRGIADALGCSRNTVASVLGAAKAKNLVYDQVAGLDPVQVRDLLLPESQRVSDRTAPDFEHVHRELARANVTLQLVWGEYAVKVRDSGGVPYAYSMFTQLYRQWANVTGATMRIERKPGELIEVDWAGDTIPYIDIHTGRVAPAYLFVAALPYSAYFYVEALPDMKLGSWLDAHVAAFEYFGGVGRLLIPDNLKAGVSQADRYEPALNPAYAQLAEHYGTAIIPARVRKPRDKAMAENAVRFGANQIGATLRNRQFVGLAELNEAIHEQMELLNARPFQKREGSRLEVFTRDEKPFLVPLPPTRFELAELRKAKVGPNYHVQVGGNFYSVPFGLIGKQLDVRATTKMVEVFDGGNRVASHPRLPAGAKGRYATMPEHMPTAHREQLSAWTPARFTNWAADIGPATTEVIERILASKKVVEQSYRSCLGLLSLAKKDGGFTRLEQSCQKALELTTSPSYTMVKRIWMNWQPQPVEPKSLGDAGFVRGAQYYEGR